ncbi:ATP synthase protein I [Amaricoccus macauensis]|uniref:ATP synthase protein I n=1 Tax=Amaricoccus macauensis TaxID=57001 RepID=A0A840SEU2_9RHOB|nr:AtpZ/AtpI family protein [Amaricoccus macauensis]MBB5221419.1 ATP synthase protein I [Amaricoccus macauensis]
MAEDPFDERLKRLEERIAAAKATREEPAPRGHGEYTQGSLAWRMVTELVAGMALGLGIGYAIDWAAGTMPIFLVVFALLGFAAGVRTMMRTAQEVREGRGEAALSRRPANDNMRDPGDPDEE